MRQLAVSSHGRQLSTAARAEFATRNSRGTVLVLAIYLLVNVAYLYALPFWEVASSNSTAYPEAPSVAAKTVQTFLGTRAAPIAAFAEASASVKTLQ